MSCFQVSDRHINAVLLGARAIGAIPADTSEDALQALGSLLARENAASCNARYPNHAQIVASFFFDPTVTPAEGFQLFKAIECIAYNCDETDTWECSPAKAWLEAVKALIVALVPMLATLEAEHETWTTRGGPMPGVVQLYQNVPWTL